MKKQLQTRPEKAYKNAKFLNSKAARPVRILAEFFEPMSRLHHNGVHNFIVFFGSARIKSKLHAEKELRAIKKEVKKHKKVSEQLLQKLEDAHHNVMMSHYYEDAVELARLLTVWTKKIKDPHKFFICSGGGPGIMEAANKGASLAKGKSVGLNISLPFEQFPNPYITPELNFEFHYFFMRKYWFMYLGKALVAFPGGFGTMDELMELLTLLQTQKIRKKMTVILYGSKFWKEIINFDALIRYGMISKEDMNLFKYVDTPKEACEHLIKSLNNDYPEINGNGL